MYSARVFVRGDEQRVVLVHCDFGKGRNRHSNKRHAAVQRLQCCRPQSGAAMHGWK